MKLSEGGGADGGGRRCHCKLGNTSSMEMERDAVDPSSAID